MSIAQVDLLALTDNMTPEEVRALQLIAREYIVATQQHPTGMRSAHEGYAVLKEEVDELWDEVKKKQSLRSQDKLMNEAVQCGAMALRFLVDVTQT